MPAQPLVLIAPPTTDSQILETDCNACPDTPAWAMAAPPAAPGQTYAQAPGLYFAPLPNPDYTLAFNPLGTAGPAVLNPAALQLLDSFQQPKTLEKTAKGAVATALDQLQQAALIWPAHTRPTRQAHAPHTLTAWLHVTNACNLRCDYCYVAKSAEEMPEVTGQRAVQAVFETAERRQFAAVKLKFAGGEATLNWPLVLKLHAQATQLAETTGIQLRSVVLSNGVALSQPMLVTMKQERMTLMLSLDGVGAYHDAQRRFSNGRGSFALVERAINLAQTVGLTPHICLTITRRSLAGLVEAVDYVLKRQLPFNLNFYRETDCAPEDLALDEARVIETLQAVFRRIEANLPAYRLIDRLLDRAQFDHPHQHTCGVGQSYVVIDQQGRLSPCQMLVGQSTGQVGDGDLLALVDAHPGVRNLAVDEKAGCRECTWKYWCAGGCPIATHRATGRWDVQSPNCHIYKALYPEVLRLEGLRLLKQANLWPMPPV